jgi:hypothetical protein
MSRTIKLVRWLESALYLLWVWDIFETTNEVVNDEELWTCNLAFDIPIWYNDDLHQDIVQIVRQMSTKIGV